MSKAYLIYDSADAERNGVLIQKYTRAFLSFGVEARLLFADKTPWSEIVSLSKNAAAVVNRSRYHELIETIENTGVYVSNPSVLCRTANNKLLTYRKLSGSVPMLKTVPLAANGEPPIDFPFVLKPKAGHGGNGVALIENESALASYVKSHGAAGIIAQPYAVDADRDMRVYVIGGKPKAAMLRTANGDFRSNFCLGGTADIVPLSALRSDELYIIETVCRLLPCDYCGIDILRTEGRAVLNEIEDPVGARMLYINTDTDPALEHVKYLFDK